MQTFAYKTLTSADFKAFYLKFFDGKALSIVKTEDGVITETQLDG
jgi:hypothetical protein